jgi:hypothetical protein
MTRAVDVIATVSRAEEWLFPLGHFLGRRALRGQRGARFLNHWK